MYHVFRVVGYRLHPDIKARLPSEPRIAELATATGDFVVTLSSEVSPKAQLDAYDISSVSFLPAEKLPANVSLNILNSKQPAPAERMFTIGNKISHAYNFR